MTEPRRDPREVMLAGLLVELERTRRVRSARRRAARVIAPVLLVATAVVLALLGQRASVRQGIPPVAAAERVTIERIATTAGAAEAITVRTRPGLAAALVASEPRARVTIERLDDRGLSRALAEAGCDPAVIRIGDQVMVKCDAIRRIGG